MTKKTPKQLIIDTLKSKSCMKQDVYQNITSVFEDLKKDLQKLNKELRNEIDGVDERIELGYKSRSEFEAEFRFAGDVLFFHMHTNIFQFDPSNPMYNTKYVQEDEDRAYCGMINIYNFLSESLKYNRERDSGYLVARIFVNKDKHYFVEGKRQLGVLYNNFTTEKITKEKLRAIVESCVLYSLDFDLLTPPYDRMKEISVFHVKELSTHINMKTGKRLGFQFNSADENIPN